MRGRPVGGKAGTPNQKCYAPPRKAPGGCGNEALAATLTYSTTYRLPLTTMTTYRSPRIHHHMTTRLLFRYYDPREALRAGENEQVRSETI